MKNVFDKIILLEKIETENKYLIKQFDGFEDDLNDDEILKFTLSVVKSVIIFDKFIKNKFKGGE